MCGNFINPTNRDFLGGTVGQVIADAALAVGAPYALGGAGLLGGLGGEGLADSSGLLGTGLSGATSSAVGGALGGGLGGAHNGPLGALEGAAIGGAGGYLGNGGLSDLTGAFSGTGGVGSDVSGDFSQGLGGSPDAARSLVSGTATAPSASNLTGYLPGAGASVPGGGTSGGFLDVSPTGSGLSSQFAQGLNGTGIGTDAGSNLTGDFTQGLAPASAPGGQFTLNATPTSGSSMLTNAPGGSNLLNGLLKAGLSYGLQKNNTGGYGALQNASNQSALAYQPYMQAGQAADTQLANLNGLNGQAAAQAATQQWQNTPGYQFTLGQGLNAIDAGAAQRGMLNSGNNLQAEQKFGTGLADQYYQQYLGNLQNQAGTGLTATGGYGNGITNAAGAYAAGKGQQVGNSNAATSGLLGSLFPTGGININPSAGGGYNVANSNNGGLSALLAGLFGNG